MKPPQFILTQQKYFEEIEEDFQSEAELKMKYPFLHETIHNFAYHIGLILSGWEIKEGYIVDDFYQITCCLKRDNNIYLMFCGDLSGGKPINVDFEMSKEVADILEGLIPEE